MILDDVKTLFQKGCIVLIGFDASFKSKSKILTLENFNY